MHGTLLCLYFVALLFAVISGLRQFGLLDQGAKLFSILMLISLLDELCSLYATVRYQNDIPIYDVFSIVEFVLVSLYFNYSIDVFQKRRLGIYIAIAGGLLGIADIRYQTLSRLDSYFLLLDGISVITIALYSIARLAQKYEDLDLRYYPHFWISALLTFFWGLTFLTFGLYDYLHDVNAGRWINIHIQLPANIITYIGFGLVFHFFPKMAKNNEG